jgi:hypothetical protein
MKKSARVTLTILAGVGYAAHAQSSNPCAPGSFNPAACLDLNSEGRYLAADERG